MPQNHVHIVCTYEGGGYQLISFQLIRYLNFSNVNVVMGMVLTYRLPTVVMVQ